MKDKKVSLILQFNFNRLYQKYFTRSELKFKPFYKKESYLSIGHSL